MGIFYESSPIMPAVDDAVREALMVDPATVTDVAKTARSAVNNVQIAIEAKLSWAKLTVAIVLLVAMLAAAIYTAQDPKLTELYKSLRHSFELILGAVIGLLTGEAISRP